MQSDTVSRKTKKNIPKAIRKKIFEGNLKKITNLIIKKTLLNPQQNILKFWRDVEIFNLPDLSDSIHSIDKNTPLPWILPQQPLEDAKRRYILYFGKQLKIDVAINFLKKS